MQNKDLPLERNLPASIRGAGEETEQWTTIISPIHLWFNINLTELRNYWDLIMLFVRRDLVAQYKQTVLGPLWYIIQPLFTTVVFTVVFGKIAKIPTDGIPDFLFYLSGNVVWAYFSSSLISTSMTFSANTAIFGKVYFPRLTVPIAIVISKAVQFAIQFLLFLAFYAFYYMHGASIEARIWILALPLMILQMALLGLGVGINITM